MSERMRRDIKHRACIEWVGDLYVFLRTAGGCDAGIICHTRLETESITKARVGRGRFETGTYAK